MITFTNQTVYIKLKISIIFTKKCNNLWKIFDIGLVGVSQNFHTYFSVLRLKKFGQPWSNAMLCFEIKRENENIREKKNLCCEKLLKTISFHSNTNVLNKIGCLKFDQQILFFWSAK